MKRLVAFALALVLMASTSVSASAAEIPDNTSAAVVEQTVTPRINWDGTAWLVTTDFCTITTSNNWFDDAPLVISDGNNAGPVTIRVLNEKGLQVGSEKTVEPGDSIRLDTIPAGSGTYRIQGKALEEAGNYYFDIT